MTQKIIAIACAALLVGGIVIFVKKTQPITNTVEKPVTSIAVGEPNPSTPSTPTSTTSGVVKTPVPPTKTPSTTPTPVPKPSGYTLADVAKHNTEASCWTVVNGSVYDVTSWISEHPGGSRAIIRLCGIDGSSAFNDQHGGERRPEAELASFKIGTLQ